MDNIRKHFCKPPCSEPTCGRSTFHMPAPGSFASDVHECIGRMSNYVEHLSNFCGAGTHMSEAFAKILESTEYGETAGQFHGAMKEVCGATTCVGGQIRDKLDVALQDVLKRIDGNQDGCSPENLQVIAKCFLQLMRLQCQFILTSTELLSQFCDHKKVEDMASKSPRQDTNFTSSSSRALQSLAALHIGNSQTDNISDWKNPHLLPADMDGSGDIWGHSRSRNYVPDGQSSQFGNIGSRTSNSNNTHSTVDSGSSSPWAAEKMKKDPYAEGCGITQEELDNVIDFLSGHAVSKHLQSIPESVTLPVPRKPVDNNMYYGHFHSAAGLATNLNVPDANVNNVRQQPSGFTEDEQNEISYKSDSGSNTWPVNLQQRMNGSHNTIDNQQTYLPYGAGGFGSDPEFLNYVASIGALIGHSNNYDNPVWSTVDLKLNKSWPQPNIHAPSNFEQQSWAGAQPDSSSSDESANEEALISLAFRESASTGLSGIDSDIKSDTGRLETNHESVNNTEPQPPLPPKQPWADPGIE
ncbi:uncharacterized protein LOC141902390 [Tubulanus polymorphus]|uniref:uncharacterized protein LOC141902390 n=1 Tax=Tubulanus polymorphus TaxID=672921 RepID=UPI003DA60DA4